MRQKVTTKILIVTTLAIVFCMDLISSYAWEMNCQHAFQVQSSVKQALLGFLAADLANATPDEVVMSVNSAVTNPPYIGAKIDYITAIDDVGVATTWSGPPDSTSDSRFSLGMLCGTIPYHQTYSLDGDKLPTSLRLAGIKCVVMGVNLTTLRRQNGDTFADLLYIELFLFISTTLALWIGLRCWVNHPLDSIVKVTEAISAGERNVRLPVTRSDEFGQIMRHVNHLFDTMLVTQIQADTDGLTQLYNHRYLQEKISEAIDQASGSGGTVTVLLIDLDKFKLLNDTYGHVVGDRFLQHVSTVLRRAVHYDGFVGRYGGDEFIALLPVADSGAAQKKMSLIRKLFAEEKFSPHPLVEPLPISFSMGLAVYPDNGTDSKELIAYADAALYTEKQGGFNIVEFIRKVEADYAIQSRNNADISANHGGCFGILFNLVVAVDKRDAYTKFHSEHVASWAVRLAQEIGLDDHTLVILKLAGLLHDVGKIGVPDTVLRKPGALTAEEYDIMKGHVTLSERLIQEIPYQEEVLAAVSCHHERWDGQGYPRGRAGQDMPITGRILAIVDAFSAMSMDRPYRAGLSLDVICERLIAGSDSQFDPSLIQPLIMEIRQCGDPRQVVEQSVGHNFGTALELQISVQLERAA
jgi:diguanylate cyclase (GGDEF)-like protein/putative nucleotidyltransferase with HDIG domain